MPARHHLASPKRLILAAALLLTQSLAIGAPTDLDLSFNGTGKATTSFGMAGDRAYAAAIAGDGKIVLVGRANLNPAYAIAVARYNTNGSLDTSFNGTGKVTTAINDDSFAASGVAVQPDGKIVVVAAPIYAVAPRALVCRYNANGTLDTSFNGNGVLLTDFFGGFTPKVALQADGRILICGDTQFAVLRLNTDGTYDTTFNGTGKVVTQFTSGSTGAATGLAVQSDGKIVAVGGYNPPAGGGVGSFAVVRYNSDGSLDTFFGGGTGKVTTSFGASAGATDVTIQNDGKIVVAGGQAGSSDTDFAVARYNADGTLDTTFNGTGHVATPVRPNAYDYLNSVAVQTDGCIVVCGFSTGDGQVPVLVRYLPSGALDPSFASNGKLVTSVFGIEPYSVNLQTNGRIVVAGISFGSPISFGVLRYMGTDVTEPPKLVSPVNGSANGNPVPLSFTLPENPLPGSVKLAFDDGTHPPHILTLAAKYENAGTYNFGIDSQDLAYGGHFINGTSIPNGIYTVTLSYQDAAGNAAASSSVTGVGITWHDVTRPPELTSPTSGSMKGNSTAVIFTLSENPMPGSVKLAFDNGTTTRVLTLAASHEVEGAHSFTFDPRGPIVGGHFAEGPAIPDGNYTVSLGYRDAIGSAMASASSSNVLIDTTPPTFTLPATITVEATSVHGRTVNYTASASDSGSGVASRSFLPASGGTFPIGTTTVTAKATDNVGNAAASSFDVTVRDTVPPQIANVPQNQLVEATGAAGTIVTFSTPTATDLVSGSVVVTCTPPSGSMFPVGTTTVNAVAQDNAGNLRSASFTVTVSDTIAPQLPALPANIAVDATNPQGAVVNFGPLIATDLVDGGVPLVCSPSSGSTFPIGVTTVQCSATDAAGNTATASFPVIVNDTRPVPTTTDAQSIQATHAVVAGQAVNPLGANVSISFIYGTENPPSKETAPVALNGANVSGSRQLSNLEPETVYYFRIKATNAVGSNLGEVLTFTTGSQTSPTAPVVTIISPATKTVSGPFTIAGTVMDDTEVASLTVRLNSVVLPLDAEVNPAPNVVANWSISNVTPDNGLNVIEVRAVDPNGNTSLASASFTHVNDRPALAGRYTALLKATGVPRLSNTGLVTLKVSSTGMFTGKVILGELSIPIRGVVGNDGTARDARSNEPILELFASRNSAHFGRLTLHVNESEGIAGNFYVPSDLGEITATFSGGLEPYSAKNPLPQTGNGAVAGRYNLAFLAKAQVPEMNPSVYPQGDGVASLNVRKTGTVSLSSSLPDGTPCVFKGKLRADQSVAVFVPLYGKRGFIAGDLTFADLENSDVSGIDFTWVRFAQSRMLAYSAGWPEGIKVDAMGTRYLHPDSLDLGQASPDLAAGNATVTLSGGLLSATITERLNIDPVAGRAKLVPRLGSLFKFGLKATSGHFSGTFKHTNGATTSYRGVLLNKGSTRRGVGYFMSVPRSGSGESGAVSLVPDLP